MKRIVVCLSILFITPWLSLSQSGGALNTNFHIVLSETTEPPGSVANITTTAIYLCEGYRIQTRVTREFDTLTVHIGGMIRPSTCFTAFSTAAGKAYVGNIRLGMFEKKQKQHYTTKRRST